MTLGAGYRLLRCPPYVTDRILQTYLCEYTEHPDDALRGTNLGSGRPVVTELAAHPAPTAAATDSLYCFEGGTGSLDGGAAGWSVMGYVLKRMRDDGRYDVHVVFRGSQSSSAGRGALLGLLGRGNPDWVTDMESTREPEARFSPAGSVVKGFRDGVALSMGTVAECLSHIDTTGEPPVQIHVTGHSLGGALAALYASAMVMGSYRAALAPEVQQWPWDSLELTTYGAPTVGSRSFKRAFNSTPGGSGWSGIRWLRISGTSTSGAR